MPKQFDIVIVGGGHGGAQAAIALRQNGFAGSIAMIGGEPELPYERPPLSKEYLAGEKPFERMMIRPPAFWGERNVTMLLGRKVTGLAAEQRRLTLADGECVSYGELIWAAGGSPRPLRCAGADATGVHAVRSLADVDAIREALPETNRVVVIGGGYIGLEAAAVLTKLGKQVVVLEALNHVLSRVAGPPISLFFEAEHRRQGVDLRTGAAVERIVEGRGRVTGVRLATGELLPADMVLAGIGIVPAVEPLLAAGANGGNGVHVDEYCRTTLPHIYAIGDCAAHESSFADGARVRIESVQNATDQAITAARAILGDPEAYRAVPWFWSNQYDLRLQTVGLAAAHDDLVLRGDPATRSFSVVYLRQGRVIALDCVNSTRDYVQGRKLVMSGAAIDKALLGDANIPLKQHHDSV